MPIEPTISVTYSELDGSPREEFSDDGQWRGIRELECNWSDARTLADEIVGGLAMLNNIQPVGGQIFPPRADNRNPPRAYAYSIEPLGGCTAPESATVMAYEKAKVTVEYGYRTGADDADNSSGNGTVLVDEEIVPEAENITVESSKLAWLTDFEIEGADAGAEVGQLEVPGHLQIGLGWNLTFYRVTEFSDDFIDLLGHINQFIVTSRKFNKRFEANTLLYSAFSAKRSFSTTGFPYWTLNCRYSMRRNARTKKNAAVLGWNGLWRVAAGDYDRIAPIESTTGGTITFGAAIDLYPEADFSGMTITQDTEGG